MHQCHGVSRRAHLVIQALAPLHFNMAGTYISVSAASVNTPAENLDALIKDTVDGLLNGVTWQQAEAGNLAVKISQTLTQKLQEKRLPRKFVANTFIMQKKVRSSAFRCGESDDMRTVVYLDDSTWSRGTRSGLRMREHPSRRLQSYAAPSRRPPEHRSCSHLHVCFVMLWKISASCSCLPRQPLHRRRSAATSPL